MTNTTTQTTKRRRTPYSRYFRIMNVPYGKYVSHLDYSIEMRVARATGEAAAIMAAPLCAKEREFVDTAYREGIWFWRAAEAIIDRRMRLAGYRKIVRTMY